MSRNQDVRRFHLIDRVVRVEHGANRGTINLPDNASRLVQREHDVGLCLRQSFHQNRDTTRFGLGRDGGQPAPE